MTVHYRVNKKDRKLWGALTICRKNGSMSPTLDKVTCPECIRRVTWSMDRFLDCRAKTLTP